MARVLMDNYQDLSDDNVFQFSFCCEICGQEYRSEAQKYTRGGVMDAIMGYLGPLGDVLGTSVEKSERDAKDRALTEFQDQMKGKFHKCPVCTQWACESCWVKEESTCRNDAQSIHVEREIAASKKVIGATMEAMKDPKAAMETKIGAATCPKCQAPLQGGKFCSQCGTPVAVSLECKCCHAEIQAGQKFCSSCGAEV